MGNIEDPDHNFALLLQYELDSEYARQEHYQTKCNNSTNLNIASPDEYLNSSKGIIDPQWELVDPTPNIANLFIAFNEKYFWSKLEAVCVVWSKRMMSCAGICSYQGRGGLCKIALSEPLLKLRPRKDLVETLLHEMIHAFLFVTHNNRDRDGHGPEFHKHMDRINASAGTKISVCHSFHDEVRLYQQHWWRCNGPCHQRHPYYGMVRRSQNRAPGPNDRWHEAHRQSCGGQFIKINEPEKKKPSKVNDVCKPKPNVGDIRKYFNTSGSPSQTIVPISKSAPNIGINGIHGFHDLNGTGNSAPASTAFNKNNIANKNVNSNVFGFNDFKRPGHGNTGLKSNSSSTMVIINNVVGKVPNDTKLNTINGRRSNTEIFNDDAKNYDVVRTVWINKFVKSSTVKRLADGEDTDKIKAKKQKTNGTSQMTCPICSKAFSKTEINDHIDICLKSTQTLENCKHCGEEISSFHLNEHFLTCPQKKLIPDVSDCPVCFKKIPSCNLEEHVNLCIENNSLDESVELWELKKCEICTKSFLVEEFESHIKKCFVIDLEESFSDEFKYVKCNCGKTMDSDAYKIHKTDCDQAEKDLETNYCHFCNTDVDVTVFADHLVQCIDKAIEEIPNTSKKADALVETVPCLVCNKSIEKAELEQHLDVCLNDTVMDITDFDDEFNEGKSNSSHNDSNNMHHCPVCLKLFKDEEMNMHLDDCLKVN